MDDGAINNPERDEMDGDDVIRPIQDNNEELFLLLFCVPNEAGINVRWLFDGKPVFSLPL
jgi:hypothetical protein